MKHHGILFKAEMIRALLDGRKTQTRRLIKPQPRKKESFAASPFQWTRVEKVGPCFHIISDSPGGMFTVRPKYAVGDLLYAKETFVECWDQKWPKKISHACYRADGDHKPDKWTPSIFMPKKLSRIWLEVTAVRCERVHEITADDAKAEGCLPYPNAAKANWPERDALRCSYMVLWNTINTAPGTTWEDNCWVWVYTFKKVVSPLTHA